MKQIQNNNSFVHFDINKIINKNKTQYNISKIGRMFCEKVMIILMLKLAEKIENKYLQYLH